MCFMFFKNPLNCCCGSGKFSQYQDMKFLLLLYTNEELFFSTWWVTKKVLVGAQVKVESFFYFSWQLDKTMEFGLQTFCIVPSEFFNNDIIYDYLLTFMHRLWHPCCFLSKKKTHSGWCAQLWRILCLRHIIPILWLVFRSDRGMLILGSVVSFLFLLFFFIAIYTLKSINLNSHHDITTGLF